MIPTTLAQVVAATDARPVSLDGALDAAVTAVSTDSRQLPDGGLFVALRGANADGHDFVDQALAQGAVAALVEAGTPTPTGPHLLVEDTWRALAQLASDVRRRSAVRAVAITGSVGKTTVKDLAAAALRSQRSVHAARGSFNNELGVPLTLLGLEPHHQVLVAELGARHVGDIATLAPLVAPEVSVVTAVAGVHLEIFGSIDAIALAKRELVEALSPQGTAVLNVGDSRVAAMASHAPGVLGVALDAASAVRVPDVHARDIAFDRLARPRATAVTPWGEVELSVPLSGRHQLLNGLFALAVAGHLGVEVGAAAAAIATAEVSPWRGAVEEVAGAVVLDDAYNANPTAVLAALATLDAMERRGRAIAVLGEMAEIGPDATAEHRRMGARCAELGLDHVVVVGAGAAAIAEGASDGPGAVHHVDDADAAARLLAELLAPGDAVLVKASRVAGLEVVVPRVRALLGSGPTPEAGR
ncbi:MAG: UDP-N-acetylmuramoyl-tripeptide--D-alanyl-D-alanine ligase [Nitriliruptoraceae bacterium]|nr:UDP-N-acetylmuramoyl-tripeptide--D-alanyl-D-alanine ligase [Nitriliruptoraceae bacterium]